MLFRIGGDEFVLISPSANEIELEPRLEQVLSLIHISCSFVSTPSTTTGRWSDCAISSIDEMICVLRPCVLLSCISGDTTGAPPQRACCAKVIAHGPIFADIVLVDEINRAPAKTQAALFEVMEERQVSIDLSLIHIYCILRWG